MHFSIARTNVTRIYIKIISYKMTQLHRMTVLYVNEYRIEFWITLIILTIIHFYLSTSFTLYLVPDFVYFLLPHFAERI